MSKEKSGKPAARKEYAFAFFTYFIIFGAMISRGAFFSTWLIILNLFFLILIVLHKEPLAFDLNAIFLMVLLLVAVLSVFIVSCTLYTALTEFLKYLLYPLSYICFLNTGKKEHVEKAFYHSFVLLAAAGLLAMTGLPLMSNMVIEETRRLQSFLQYANTTAVLLSAGILLAVHYFQKTKKKIHIFYGMMMLVALILTKSRIGFWIFIAVITAYILFRLTAKIRLIIISAIGIALMILLVIGVRVMSVSIFEATLMERFLTYIDAAEMLKTNVFGIGMGEWQFKQLQYQSAPYYVMYVHNVYLQAALDCGILGSACFAAVVINAFVKSKKSIYFFILALLAVGSILEVNFAFGFVIIFFTFMLSSIGSPQKCIEIKKPARFILLIPILLLSLLLLSEFVVFVGKTNQTEPKRALEIYRAAHTMNPANYKLFYDMAKAEQNPQKALDYLLQGHIANPLDRAFLVELALGHSHSNNHAAALYYAEKLFELHRYSKETQALYMDVLKKAFEKGALTNYEYAQKTLEFSAKVESVNASIHFLYRYVNPQMEYKH